MTKSRGQNEGNIKKRKDGRWEARISLEDGSRKSFYGATRQEVAIRLNEALRNKKQGLPAFDERQTVETYLLSWLETMKQTIKPSTWKYYQHYILVQTIPLLGKLTLARLKAQHI